MKKIIIPILLAQSFLSFGQKIKEVEIDKFTGAKRIRTSNEILCAKLIPNRWISTYYRTVDTTFFITFTGNYGLGVVGPSDPTTFLFEDKSTIKVYPTGIQSYEGFGDDANYDQQYYVTKEQIKKLSENKLVALRREYNSNYVDIDIKEKFAKRFAGLSKVLLDEMDKK